MAEPLVANSMLPEIRSDGSDLLRLQRERPGLVAEAERVFGEPERAHMWLLQSLPSLDGFTPAETAACPGGEEQVRDLLLRIEHGIFS